MEEISYQGTSCSKEKGQECLVFHFLKGRVGTEDPFQLLTSLICDVKYVFPSNTTKFFCHLSAE